MSVAVLPARRATQGSDAGVEWLLSSADPSVRYLTLTEVLRLTAKSPRVRAARELIPDGPRVRALLSGQRKDGGFGVHPYGKWTGAHWRLVSLVELAIPPGEPRALAALEDVLRWLASPTRLARFKPLNGRVRRCASQEGNAVAVACRLGAATDPRVETLAQSLVAWQWPDGGWNCDIVPEATHSSVNESLPPLWALTEHHRATGEPRSKEAADRAAEFFLRHRVFRSHRTGAVMHPEVVKLHYPPYWHYDVLQGLLVLGRAGRLGDPRASEALDLIESKRLPDGRWRAGGRFWKGVGTKYASEVVDWGMRGPNEMITLNALRVLAAASRL
jgi:hypothetical protein